MTTISRSLLENSLQAALSSIEIYNKPDFKYREQVFVILIVNAWELLLKAKILKDNDDDLSSLYVYQKGQPKTNRSGNPLTIEIFGAVKRLNLAPPIHENLNALIEIRDTVVHFFTSESLSYLVYTLGVAALRNYQRLVKDWFDQSLLNYNFYILPLGFAYNFQTLSLIDLDKEPEAISKLLQTVSTMQAADESSETSGYHFVCEVATQVISAKKLTGGADFTTAVDPNATGTIVFRDRNLIDKYPIDYKTLMERVKQAKPNIKQPVIHKVIREHHIKSNPNFSAYNFRTQRHKDAYERDGILPKGIVSIYNEDAIRYIIENLEDD